MNDRIRPEVFARVLRLDDNQRAELLEALGDDPISQEALSQILDEMEIKERMARLTKGRRPS
ncbi:MAG: hypothetical protein AAGF30_08115 [Pseudomonadota bacterium]